MIPVIYCKIRPFGFILPLFAVVVFCFCPLNARGAETAKSGVVVLDPGHGGKDQGATGTRGLSESAAALVLATRIREKLTPGYDVFLTRTDDYDMPCYGRTSLANHYKSDVFISIHTGGGFLRQTRGIEIYYFDDPGRDIFQDFRDNGPIIPATDDAIPWDDIQVRHASKSKKFAQSLKAVFSEDSSAVRVRPAPILVLRGADMPAVLIEFGYITNPADETALSDMNHIDAYADMVKKAIDGFLKKPLESTD